MKQTKKEMLFSIEEKVKKSRIIGNNTLLIDYKDGRRAVRLHNTDIITFSNDVITLNSGGWKTVTTKDRINAHCRMFEKIPYLYQRDSQWFIGDGVFYDGIQFKNGEQISEIKRDNQMERSKIKRKISNYCKLITKDNLPVPNAGDCWYCMMVTTDTKKPMGDAFKNYDHLISHLEEGYLVGSLLVNAMLEAGYSKEQVRLHYGMKLYQVFRRNVSKYLTKRLVS